MSWVRIDDGFPLHRKAAEVGPNGVGIFVGILGYCARNLTDGRIPKKELSLAWPWGGVQLKKVADSLVQAGLLEDIGDAYQVHDYLEYQPSRAEIEAKRAAERDKKRRQRGNDQPPSGPPRSPTGTDEVVPQGQPAGQNRLSPRESLARAPALTRPDPTLPIKRSQSSNNNTHEKPLEPPEAVREASASRASVRQEISSLERRYEPELVKGARDACALSRRNGSMSDSVWLTTLRKLAGHPVEASQGAMKRMIEQYADGEKDERYMLGIASRLAREGPMAPRGSPVRLLPPAPANAFPERTEEEAQMEIQRLFGVSNA